MSVAFDGTCPWCGLAVDAGIEKPPLPHSRRCPCGAVALGAAERKPVVDAMAAYYKISPSKFHGDIYKDTHWLKDFHIETKDGGRTSGKDQSAAVVWSWFRRRLPWEKPAGPQTDQARLEWLQAQGEKFYDLMYDSRSPSFEFRQAKETFEDAIVLAKRLGLTDEAEALSKRLEHIRAVFRSQFS